MQPPAQVFPAYPWQHPPAPFFGLPDRSTDGEYPSPTPSHPSPAYSPSDHFPLLSHFPQIESSIGPSRVLTRRQRAALEHAHLARGPSSNFQRGSPVRLPTPSPTHSLTLQSQTSALYSAPDSTHESTEDHPERPSLNIAGDGNLPLQSPNYHPMTPTSMSSPSYPYPGPHSKSAPPRDPSPALSTVSALTSVSSASAHLRPYPRPSTHVVPIPRAKQKKQRLDNHARKDICLYQDQHPNARQEDIATIFKVERSTISKILKHKTKWLSMPDNLANRAAKHRQVISIPPFTQNQYHSRPSKFPEIEDALIQWLEECSDRKVILSDSAIRTKAKETARMLHISDEKFKASSGWVENFKSRHGIRAGVWAGAAKPSSQPRILMAGPSLDSSSILSPLNPAFTSHAEGMNLDAPASPHRHHHDPESDAGSPEPEHGDRHHTRPLPESPVIVPRPPPWSGEQHSNDAPASPTRQLPPFSHGSSSSSMPPQPTSPRGQHPSSSHSQAGLDRHPYLDESATVYYHTPHIPSPRMPTLADAEDAINTLITYLDSAGQGILQDHERQALNTVKCALFQAGSGVPFDRSRH